MNIKKNIFYALLLYPLLSMSLDNQELEGIIKQIPLNKKKWTLGGLWEILDPNNKIGEIKRNIRATQEQEQKEKADKTAREKAEKQRIKEEQLRQYCHSIKCFIKKHGK